MMNAAYIHVRNISYRYNPVNTAHTDIFIENDDCNEPLYCDREAPDNAKDLFLYVHENGGENTRAILNFVFEYDKCIYIDGLQYSCNTLKEWLESKKVTEDGVEYTLA